MPDLATKRILVTGGAGFIGSNLIRHLIHHTKCHILNLDSLSYAGNLESLTDVADHERYSFSLVDLNNQAALREAIKQFHPDTVMHLAAESHVDRSIDAPGKFIQTNVVGTFKLLHECLHYWQMHMDSGRNTFARDFRFLHVSTDEVYGSLGSADPAFNEETPYRPHSPYSASKAASDHLVLAWYDTYGLPVLITNCSNNYGPFQFPEKLIPVVILKCLRGEAIPVYGKGENIRDWLYVEDHCRALVRVLEKGTPGQTYNIGGNNEKRNIDLVREICSILDELAPSTNGKSHADKIRFVTDRPGHDLRYAIDPAKITSELGWKPQENCMSGLHNTVQWYLDHRQWWERILSGDYQLERLGLS